MVVSSLLSLVTFSLNILPLSISVRFISSFEANVRFCCCCFRLLRMDSWGGIIRLALYYDDGCFSAGQAQQIVSDVVRTVVDYATEKFVARL